MKLVGEANDYVCKSMSGGEVAIMPPAASPFAPEDCIIAGNTCLYGATGGKAFFNGRAGERFAVRNSLAETVVEGSTVWVELAPSRHRLALAARSAAPAEVRERVVLVEGDIGASETAGLLMEKSTVLWLANLLFDGPLERRIAVLIEASPAVRCVAALCLRDDSNRPRIPRRHRVHQREAA